MWILALALLLSGCSPEQDNLDSSKPAVFVSIPPQAGLLKTMAGDKVSVHTLVGEGQSPHSYEPTAKQLATLGKADILFTLGVPFEQALLKKIKPLYPDLKIVATDAGIEKRAVAHSHTCSECTHHHGEPDPHVWLSPENAAQMAANMYAELNSHNVDAANYEQLNRTLNQLHSDIKENLKPYHGKRFYVFHPSFGYFADAYGLEQIPIEMEGKAPSPRQLADLIEEAKADGIKTIFVQKQFPTGTADAVADAIGGKVVQLDPLAEDVVANLRQISESIANSYK